MRPTVGARVLSLRGPRGTAWPLRKKVCLRAATRSREEALPHVGYAAGALGAPRGGFTTLAASPSRAYARPRRPRLRPWSRMLPTTEALGAARRAPRKKES